MRISPARWLKLSACPGTCHCLSAQRWDDPSHPTGTQVFTAPLVHDLPVITGSTAPPRTVPLRAAQRGVAVSAFCAATAELVGAEDPLPTTNSWPINRVAGSRGGAFALSPPHSTFSTAHSSHRTEHSARAPQRRRSTPERKPPRTGTSSSHRGHPHRALRRRQR